MSKSLAPHAPAARQSVNVALFPAELSILIDALEAAAARAAEFPHLSNHADALRRRADALREAGR